jgi:hypothetical protein
MVSITFRTSGGWGSGQGSNLTAAQVDTNFYNLKSAVEDLQTNPTEPNNIANIVASGSQLTIYMEDSTSFGPFTIPRTRFAWRGEWAADTVYFSNDVVSVAGQGIYLVLVGHTSDGTFDADETNSDLDSVYEQLFGIAAPSPVTSVASSTSTPALTDANKYIRCTNAGGCVVTIPPNSSVAFPLYTELHYRQAGGAITFLAGSGVTINPVDGFDNSTNREGAVATLKQVAANSWDIFGLLAEESSAGVGELTA